MVWRYEQRCLGEIVGRYRREGDMKHLDFACGTGRILEYLERFDRALCVGVDISPSMLDIARQRTTRSEIIEGDITQRDILGKRTFSLITAFRFFPNAQDDLREDAMRVLASHLDSHGVLVFNNHKNLAFPANRLMRRVGRGFERGMTRQEAEHLASTAGLRIQDVYHFGAIPEMGHRLLLPLSLLEMLENSLSRCNFLRNYALNQVYVCRRAA